MRSPAKRPGLLCCPSIFPQYADYFALHLHRLRRNDDWRHRRIRRLQADLVAFAVETLKRSLRAVNQRNHDVAVTRGLGLFHHHVIAIDNVLVLHGVAAHFQHEYVTLTRDVIERDGLRIFQRLDWPTGGNSSEQWQGSRGLQRFTGSRSY